MSVVVDGYIKYYPSGDYYIVGDNSSTYGNGISQTSYSGEITIKESINGRGVIEIGQHAFMNCPITKLTIYAKLRSINYYSFCWCTSLQYINIPSTVTFIGMAALYLGDPSVTIDRSIFVEFNGGRTEKVFISDYCFTRRTKFYIVYPSNLVPLYSSTSHTWEGTTTCYICAPSVFDFFTKQTTPDTSKCPNSQFVNITKSTERRYNTCNTNYTPKYLIIMELLILLLS
jgi:hypothetical protein